MPAITIGSRHQVPFNSYQLPILDPGTKFFETWVRRPKEIRIILFDHADVKMTMRDHVNSHLPTCHIFHKPPSNSLKNRGSLFTLKSLPSIHTLLDEAMSARVSSLVNQFLNRYRWPRNISYTQSPSDSYRTASSGSSWASIVQIT